MNDRFTSLQRITHVLIILFLIGYLLIIGKNILIPITFAAFFAFMLKPLCGFIERGIPWRVPAIFLTFLIVAIPVLGVLALLSFQLVDVVQNLTSISEKLQASISDLFIWLNQQFGFSKTESEQWISDNAPRLLEGPLSAIGQSMSSSTSFVINFVLTVIYTFFFLLYRSAIKSFIMIQAGNGERQLLQDLLDRIPKVIQKYLYGVLLVMLILGILNSSALWLIGIKYPLFWGFMASILAVIPYVGTFIGALLPFLYSLATTDNLWQPAAVVIAFNIIQTLESNFITPKVAGSSVKINPFAAILSLIIGGAMWGVAGLVLALPIIAVIKVIMEQIDVLKPFSFLLSSELYSRDNAYIEKFDREKYRLINFFKKKSSDK